MIKEIRQIIGLTEKHYLQELINNVNEMQNNNLEVEIQYGESNGSYSALIIGRTLNKTTTNKQNVETKKKG